MCLKSDKHIHTHTHTHAHAHTAHARANAREGTARAVREQDGLVVEARTRAGADAMRASAARETTAERAQRRQGVGLLFELRLLHGRAREVHLHGVDAYSLHAPSPRP